MPTAVDVTPRHEFERRATAGRRHYWDRAGDAAKLRRCPRLCMYASAAEGAACLMPCSEDPQTPRFTEIFFFVFGLEVR